MDKKTAYTIIISELRKRLGDKTEDKDLTALADSLSGTVSYAPDLQDITEEYLSKAASEIDNLEYAYGMKTIRDSFARNKTEKANQQKAEQEKYANDQANWRFFIQCWDAFCRDGDLRAISGITIGLLGSWLENNPRFISEDERNRCYGKTINGSQTETILSPAECKERIVLVVMNKMQERKQTDPEKIKAFINRKRNECNTWYADKYGEAPNWTVPGRFRSDYIQNYNI